MIERLLPLLHRDGLRVAVITNDLVTTEDAERLQASGLVRPELVVGIDEREELTGRHLCACVSKC